MSEGHLYFPSVSFRIHLRNPYVDLLEYLHESLEVEKHFKGI